VEPRKLARLWIYAIVLSAAADAAASVLIVGLSRMLAVSDSESGPLVTTIFLALAGAIAAATTALFGFLTGRVLDCALPAFPIRAWIAVHALIGLFYGSVGSIPLTSPEEPQTWTPELIRFYAIGAVVAAIIVGLLLGAIQALVLRRTARGLRLWIACSALAGTFYVLRVPVDIYGPQTGIANDLAGNGAGFLSGIIQGFVLLPAMLRLRPRGEHPVPGLFE
jgi:hypothetical protein